METLKQLWGQQVQIFPLLFAILLIDIVGFIRKMRPLPYVPIYFSAYPLNDLNKRVADYYETEDPTSGTARQRLSDVQLTKLKRRATMEGIFSFVLAAVVVPLVCGFLCTFFLRKEDLGFLIFIVLIYKSSAAFHAVRHFEKDAISNHRSSWIVLSIYAAYILTVCWTLRSTYTWASPFVEKQQYGAMANEAINFVVIEIILKAVVLAILAALFNNYIMNRNAKNELTRESASGESSS